MNNQRDTLAHTFEVLRRELEPFVKRHMQPVHGDQWEAAAKKGTSAERGNRPLDCPPY